MTTNEFELIRELTEVANTVAELKAENRTLKDINEKLMQALRTHDVSGSLLKSLHQDLKGFQEMGFLTPDAKSGLGIAIEQVERYMRGDLKALQ